MGFLPGTMFVRRGKPTVYNWGGFLSLRMKMKKQILGIIGSALICGQGLWALDSIGSPFKLEPTPKEVQLHNGGFQVGPHTRILVQLGHQSEDRIAAETLAEEVANQSGLRLDIVGMKAAGKAED